MTIEPWLLSYVMLLATVTLHSWFLNTPTLIASSSRFIENLSQSSYSILWGVISWYRVVYLMKWNLLQVTCYLYSTRMIRWFSIGKTLWLMKSNHKSNVYWDYSYVYKNQVGLWNCNLGNGCEGSAN